MQFRGKVMVAFKSVDLFQASRGLCAQSRKQRLFFICRVPFATRVKVLERSFYSRLLFAGKAPGVRTLDHQAQDVEEVLNPAMAVLQHADRIVESAIRSCAYLYRHSLTFFL